MKQEPGLARTASYAGGCCNNAISLPGQARARAFSIWLPDTSPVPAMCASSASSGASALGASIASNSACLTTSWWKNGTASSRRQRAASALSSLAMYSCRGSPSRKFKEAPSRSVLCDPKLKLRSQQWKLSMALRHVHC